MKKVLLIGILIGALFSSNAQLRKSALFIGNSYTFGIPSMVSDLATSVGDTLDFEEATQGGQRLSGHARDPFTLDRIAQGNWDYVILQEQSQLPSFPEGDVLRYTYPFAKQLCDSIHKTCATPMFYMTWGRRDGDLENCQFYKPLCTYRGMDSMLRMRYEKMAKDNFGEVSAVGAVWRKVREDYPKIELYTQDGSHPNQFGSYVSAVTFYTSIFRKDPTKLKENGGLDSLSAARIRTAAKDIILANLKKWNIGKYDLEVDFLIQSKSQYDYRFTNFSINNNGHVWEIDGKRFKEDSLIHSFTKPGKHIIKLTSFNPCDTVVKESEIEIFETSIKDIRNMIFNVYPNPSNGSFKIADVMVEGSVIDVLNTLGQSMDVEITNTPTGVNVKLINSSKGVYYLHYRKREGILYSEKIIVY